MISAVIIEGVTFPVAYNGYTYSRNKIWSKNTGRNDYGEMVGTIVAIKDKIELLELIRKMPLKVWIQSKN